MLSHPERGRLTILPENNELPIRTELLGEEGFFGGSVTCFRLSEKRGSYAVKIHRYTGLELDKVIRQGEREYENLRSGPLSEHIPESLFMKGHGFENEHSQIVLQPWVEGRKVGEMGVNEIVRNPRLLKALKQFQTKMVERFMEQRQWLDYAGIGLKPEEKSLQNRINSLSLLASRNLIWDGNRLWLVDTTNNWWGFENGLYKNLMTFWRLNRRRLVVALAMLRDRCWINRALMREKT